MSDESVWLVPPDPVVLEGDERFRGIENASVQEFWRFALGDLRMNNARGYLAEYIVGKALGIVPLRRTEWDSYDLLFGSITVEVKSSAYLQSWEQRRIGTPRFAGLRGTRYHPRVPNNGMDPVGPRLNAMVYVFCLQTATKHAEYDQLNIGQWEFYVLPRSVIADTGYASMSLPTVRAHAHGPTPLSALSERVVEASLAQEREDDDPNWWKALVP